MIVLDENVSENEIWRLREAGIALRVIGPDISIKSVSDENIIPLLLKLKRPKLARYIRLFLRHRMFNTTAKRLGKVMQIQLRGIHYWFRGKLDAASW